MYAIDFKELQKKMVQTLALLEPKKNLFYFFFRHNLNKVRHDLINAYQLCLLQTELANEKALKFEKAERDMQEALDLLIKDKITQIAGYGIFSDKSPEC